MRVCNSIPIELKNSKSDEDFVFILIQLSSFFITFHYYWASNSMQLGYQKQYTIQWNASLSLS